MADSMRKVRTDSGIVFWDSAFVTLTISEAASANNTPIALYKLKRAWGEGVQTGATGTGVTWVNADSTSGNAATTWGTAGCNNTTSDRSATAEGASVVIALNQTGAVNLPVSGATVTDTLGNLGLLLKIVSGSGYVTFHSEDAATANRAYRIKITVYYHPLLFPAKQAVDTNSYSFILKDLPSADVAMAYIDTALNNIMNTGASVLSLVGRGYVSTKRKTKEIVLRFETLVPTYDEIFATDTGVWIIDSGRITLNVGAAMETADSLKLAIKRLKSGVDAASRHFLEGTQDELEGAGVSWDSVGGTLVWTTAGARGAADTIGGIIEETGWLTPANAGLNADISWKMTAASLTDITVDTTTAQYPGWIIYPTAYAVAAANNSQYMGFDSDDAADITERPRIQIWLRNIRNLVEASAIMTVRGTNTAVGARNNAVRGYKP
jgi:hypothetical protein